MNTALLASMLREEEAVATKPYVDTEGKMTIGVGRNLTDNGVREDEIALMLSNDIADVVDELTRRLPVFSMLDDVRQRVLADMAFNMGAHTLLTFVKMLAAIEAGAWQTAASEMLASKWASEVGQRAKRLAKMMTTGQDCPLW